MALADLFLPPSSQVAPPYTSDNFSTVLPSYSDSFPDWEQADVALLGCPSTPTDASYLEADCIRAQIQSLSIPDSSLTFVDLGNLKPQPTVEAFHESLADVIAQLRTHKTLAVLFGGTPSYTLGQFLGHLEHKGRLTYTQVGSKLFLETESLDTSFNHRILTYQPSPLFQFTNLGYQQFFVSPKELEWLNSHNQMAIRYGELLPDMGESEPHLRNAHMVSVDLSSIRTSECPGTLLPSPGGFSAAEGCQIARYIGLGQELQSVQLTGYRADKDPERMGALLSAMMLWYILLGRSQRAAYQVPQNKSQLRRYNVQLRAGVEAINFYLHVNSNRWWMEVPYQSELGKKRPKSLMIPCSKREYEIAQQDQIPEKWWTIYNKLV